MYQVTIYNAAKRETTKKYYDGIPAAVAFIDEFCANHNIYFPMNMYGRLNSFDRQYNKPIVLDKRCDGRRSENILEITLI